jgi:hypothetical protein
MYRATVDAGPLKGRTSLVCAGRLTWAMLVKYRKVEIAPRS